MKKLFLGVSAIVIILAIYHISLAGLSEKTLSFSHNIEALAWGEGENEHGCLFVGSLDCPANGNKVKFIY